jgi:hypothetical protein
MEISCKHFTVYFLMDTFYENIIHFEKLKGVWTEKLINKKL